MFYVIFSSDVEMTLTAKEKEFNHRILIYSCT